MTLLRRPGYLALVIMVSSGVSAARADDFGAYAGVGTISPCPSFCGGPGSHSDFIEDGGPSLSSASTSLTALEGFGSAAASLTGATYLPVLGVFADSNPNARVTSQAVGYNAYRYIGSEPTTIDVDLALDGTATAGASLDAQGRASVAVILGNDLPFYTSYGTLVFEEVPGNPDLELLGTTELFLLANMGNTTVTGSVTIDLSPGDKFFVWASLTGSGVRNGIVDADNTFTAAFSDPTNIVLASVPEPASTTLLLIAISGLSLGKRSRRSVM